MQEVVTAYKDKGDAQGVKQVQSTGLHVAGERFVVLKADDRSIYGKKVSTKTSDTCRSHRGFGICRALFEPVFSADHVFFCCYCRAVKASLSSKPNKPSSSPTTPRPCSPVPRPTRSSSWPTT